LTGKKSKLLNSKAERFRCRWLLHLAPGWNVDSC